MVYLVSRITEFASGARVPMLLRAFSDEKAAERFVATCQQELAAYLEATLVAGPSNALRPVGRGNLIMQLAGITGVGFTVVPVEVAGAVELAPARLIVPS